MVTYALEADFDRNGSYESDLSEYITTPAAGFSFTRGIDPAGMVTVSQFTVGLDNTEGTFTAENPGSPYYGQMDPDVPVRMQATHDATTYTLWTGYITQFKRRWASGQPAMVSVTCRDLAHYLIDSEPVNVAVATNRDTDAALIAIMDALGLTSADRDFDDGLQDLPFHFAQSQTGMEAMMAVVRSELGGWPWINANGQIRFEARDSRLGTSVAHTWGDGTDVLPYEVEDLTDDHDYVTTVRVRNTIYAEGQANHQVFTFQARGQHHGNSLELAAGEVYERELSASQGVTAFTAVEAGIDYAANSAANGSGTDRTSDLDVTITDLGAGRFRLRFENTSGSELFVTRFQLRGTQVAFYSDRPEAVATLTRAGLPVGRSVNVDIPFGGDAVYQPLEWAYTLLRTYRYVIPRKLLRFHGVDDDELPSLLALELGDRVAFKDTGIAEQGSYTDDVFYVESIGFHVPANMAGVINAEVVLTPSYAFRNLDAIAFDTFNRDDGALGTTTNGKTWADATGFSIDTLTAVPNTDTLSLPNIDIGVSDMVAEVILGEVAGAAPSAGLVYRYADASNYWHAYINDGDLNLDKIVAATRTNVATVAVSVTAGELRAMAQGNRHRVWWNFTLLIDEEDSALNTNTKAGMAGENAQAVSFDDAYFQGLN